MVQKIHPKLKTLFVTYGGSHYKLFNILNNNFNNTSLMDKRFEQDFKKHFNYVKNSNLIFSKTKFDLFLKIRKIIKNKDLIISNCPISGALVYFATLFKRKKKVFLMCQDFYEYFEISEKKLIRKWLYGSLLKFFIRLSCRHALTIVLSNYIKKKAIGYGSKNIKIIPIYGIDMTIFKPKETNIKFDSTKKIILTTARFSPEKGLIYILKAISELENVLLVMVGPGKNKELKEVIDKLRINDKVKIIGEVDPIKIADYYNSCDIFVLPSLREGLGFSSGESMACKKPVIASNTGGIPDIVIKNQTGILIESGNIKQLKEAILKLINSKQFSKKLIENGFKHIKDNYQEQELTKKFVETLEKF